MYTQKTVIEAPMGKMSQLRDLIAKKYLPVVRTRPGFLGAYLMEQIDDPDHCELVQFWDSQTSIENFHRTGLLQASIQTIAVDMPGIRMRRQGYIVRVAVGSVPSEEQASQA